MRVRDAELRRKMRVTRDSSTQTRKAIGRNASDDVILKGTLPSCSVVVRGCAHLGNDFEELIAKVRDG